MAYHAIFPFSVQCTLQVVLSTDTADDPVWKLNLIVPYPGPGTGPAEFNLVTL